LGQVQLRSPFLVLQCELVDGRTSAGTSSLIWANSLFLFAASGAAGNAMIQAGSVFHAVAVAERLSPFVAAEHERLRVVIDHDIFVGDQLPGGRLVDDRPFEDRGASAPAAACRQDPMPEIRLGRRVRSGGYR
jgi:hypothetical protein